MLNIIRIKRSTCGGDARHRVPRPFFARTFSFRFMFGFLILSVFDATSSWCRAVLNLSPASSDIRQWRSRVIVDQDLKDDASHHSAYVYLALFIVYTRSIFSDEVGGSTFFDLGHTCRSILTCKRCSSAVNSKAWKITQRHAWRRLTVPRGAAFVGVSSSTAHSHMFSFLA